MLDQDFLMRYSPYRQSEYWRHMALLFMALFVGSGWDDSYRAWRQSKLAWQRRSALRGRARAVVLFDRVLNNELPEAEAMNAG